MSKWSGIEHFTPGEFDDPGLMDPMLLRRLEAFRRHVGRPFIITSSTGGKHSPGSQHYLGKAVDVVILNGERLMDNYLMSERFGFNGIGVYPHWSYSGDRIGGLHLDVRDGSPARWMGVMKEGSQVYVSLNEANLDMYL